MLYTINLFLKRNKYLYRINSLIKSTINTHKTNSLYSFYSNESEKLNEKYSEQKIPSLLSAKLLERGIDIKSKSTNKPRIFWVGAHFEQDSSGFLTGLNKLGEVFHFYNCNNEYGLLWKKKGDRSPFDLEVIKDNNKCLFDQVSKLHNEKPIDLVIGQMWANVVDAETLIRIQQLGIITVNISMDDKLPHLWGTYKKRRLGSVGLTAGLDLVLTTSPDTCSWYWVEKCLASYWPLASDPKLFYPRNKKIYDVVFVGGKYGIRGKLVQQLIIAGIKVEAFGPGWPNGFITAEKTSEVFGQAKIILGSGFVGYNTDILTIKLRDFDAPMSGALYITNRNPDLLKLFTEGVEIECYSTTQECIKKIKHYLGHPDLLQRVSTAGLIKARSHFTWEIRVKHALALIGFENISKEKLM